MPEGTLILAPLQGVTDPIVRDILTSFGGIDACVSAFSRVSTCSLPTHALVRACPEMAREGRTRAGSPVHLQLLGGNPHLLAETAEHGAAGGAPVIDLNFGCPVGRVNRHDGGAALLRDPERMTRIISSVRRALPSSVPVSAKIRTGWRDASEVVDLAKAVEQGGAAWVTIHGRTRDQQYHGQADWVAIGRARQAVGIVVVANGDICSPEDLARCAATTGCEHFMVGRGSLARPELFRRLAGLQNDWWQPHQRLEVLVRYGDQCADAGIPDGNIAGRVKGWFRYMAGADFDVSRAFGAVRRETTWATLRSSLARWIVGLQSEY